MCLLEIFHTISVFIFNLCVVRLINNHFYHNELYSKSVMLFLRYHLRLVKMIRKFIQKRTQMHFGWWNSTNNMEHASFYLFMAKDASYFVLIMDRDILMKAPMFAKHWRCQRFQDDWIQSCWEWRMYPIFCSISLESFK